MSFANIKNSQKIKINLLLVLCIAYFIYFYQLLKGKCPKTVIQQAYVQSYLAFQLQVALLNSNANSLKCGGSIISPTCIVTAAHCVAR